MLPIRLTRMHKIMIDQNQMQKLAMISPKDAKTLSYKLMQEGFLQLKEEKKATSNVGPVKSFNFFHVDLPQVMKIFGIFMCRVIEIFYILQVAREVLKVSYKCVSNALERQAHDLTANKCLLERHALMEKTLKQLRGEDAPDDLIAEVSIFHFWHIY